jgi:hypothetical protein
MPSPYTGSPTATEGSSPAPGPGGLPIVELPVDGDPPNASTFEQALKVPADWLAWLAAPTAISGAFAQEVMAWQNARGQRRFFIDHQGYPASNLVTYRETWRGSESATDGLVTVFKDTDQIYGVNVVNAGTTSMSVARANADMSTRHLALSLDAGATDSMNISSIPTVRFEDARGIVIEGTVRTGSQVSEYTFTWGLATIAPGWDAPSAGFSGMLIQKKTGDDWKLSVGDGTNLLTSTTFLSCLANTDYRLRLEFLGSGVADDSTTQVRAYINGSLMGVATTALPSADPAPYAGFVSSLKRTTGTSTRNLYLGPYRIITNEPA